MGVLGKPKYKWGDAVTFAWGNLTYQGVIEIVDAYGTFGQNKEPSYDICVDDPEIGGLYKHVRESEIVE